VKKEFEKDAKRLPQRIKDRETHLIYGLGDSDKESENSNLSASSEAQEED